MLERQLNRIVLLVILCICAFPPVFPQAQQAPPDPRFGVVEAFWDTTAAVEASVAWERVLFQWSQLQPNGPDDWNTLHVPDEWLSWAGDQGREVVGLLKNTPHWATDADPPLEASPPRGLDLPIDDPGNTWATFVRLAVNFYAPRGVHRWIIWNEPDIPPGVYGQEWAGSVEEYYRLLQVAYQVIKEVDPEAQVHLAGLTFWHDREWLRQFLSVATADPDGAAHGYFFDVVSLHIYFQTDTVDYIVNEARAALSAYGLNKPVWINETNASPDTDPEWPVERPRWRVDLREQASFILQAYALGLAAGAERVAVYKFIDAGLPPGGEPFGLLRPDHSRRPAYTAYQLATSHYAGTRSATLTRQALWAQVTLDRGERSTRVFWARTQADVSLSVPAWAAQATLVDQQGNTQTLDGSGGSYALTLPGARCADPADGCIIGGPTLLLIEEGAPGQSEAPVADTATPTIRPTSPGVTIPPTPTASETPLATPSPSPTPTVTPRPTATPSETPSATPSPTPSLTIAVSPTSLPSQTATVTPAPPVTDRRAISGAAIGLTVAVLAGLGGLAVWYRGKRRTERNRR